MEESEITEFIESLSVKLERRNDKLQDLMNAWLGTLDALGLAWAVMDVDAEPHYRLNNVARKDLGRITGDVDEVIVPEGREVLISKPSFLLWKPNCVPQTLDLSTLSARELEVREWMLQGKSLEETAMILGISPRTVEKHRQKIYQKIGKGSSHSP